MTDAPGLEFRRVGPGLEGGLAALFAALDGGGDGRWFHPHPLTAAEAARLCAYRGRDLYYAAADQGGVLAYGLLRGWDEGYEVPSLGVAVHPAARGGGLAKAFMLFLHAAAAARGARQVRLKVYPDNTPARRLYEGLGYRLGPAAGGQLLGVLDLRRGRP
jgi:ribosomal protein S18 acetylase RimI-like enzyme